MRIPRGFGTRARCLIGCVVLVGVAAVPAWAGPVSLIDVHGAPVPNTTPASSDPKLPVVPDGGGTTRDSDDYMFDDGTLENAMAYVAPAQFVWFNEFTVQPGLEVINAVSIAYGVFGGQNGSPVTIFVLDSNMDLLGSVEDVIQGAKDDFEPPQLGNFVKYNVGGIAVGAAGDTFFVGAGVNIRPGGDFPIALDESSYLSRSWVAYGDAFGGDPTCQPSNLSACAVPPLLIGDDGFPANFLIRANASAGQAGACCDHAQPGGACQDDVPESECVSSESKEFKISAELPIPDNDPTGVRHEFFVPDRGIIGDLDVDLLISHTWRGDLVVTVSHKDTGTSAILTAFPNSGVDDNIGNPATLEKVFFDDEAGELFDNILGNSPVGHYRPTEPLSVFDGEDKIGLWSILVQDFAGADEGILHQWSLNFLNEDPVQAEWFQGITCADVEEQGLCEEHTGACCDAKGNGCSDGVPETQCPTDDPRVSWYKGLACDELDTPCRPRSVSITDKGSLLIFSKVEIKWDAAGNVTQDTFLDITNDYPKDVFVQLYFVNGDEPADPVFAGDPPQLIERSHPGWNWVDCQVRLTNDQPMYWSALTGGPLGCQMFTVLDPGTPPGRPDLDGAPGSRVLRGFVYAWAVDQFGEEICWNHLKGDAVIVNYADPSAWEYNAYAAKTTDKCDQGAAPDDVPGHICLNGREYDACYDRLLLDFYASGSTALSGGGATVQVDTDLTLFPVDADLRQDTCGPVVTKAKFDIWNMNEIRFSGTTRCITCWDQTLLSNYDPPNHFLLGNLHTDKGKARIDGIGSQVCDANDCTKCDWPKYSPCSQNAPLLGVVKKELAFSGGATGRAAAGMTLVGMGEESTCIQYDIIEPPEELQGQVDNGIAPVEDASPARIKVRK